MDDGHCRAPRIPWRPLGRALRVAGNERRWMIAGALGAVAATALGFASPYFLQRMTDTVVSGDLRPLAGLLLASLAAALAGAGAGYTRSLASEIVTAKTVSRLRAQLAAHIQRLPLPVFERYRSGDLISRANDDLTTAETLFLRLPDMLQQPLKLVGGLVFMLVLSPKLTLAVCAGMPVSVWVFDRVTRWMQTDSQKEMEAQAAVNAALHDVLRGGPIVRAFRLDRVLGDRFRRSSEDIVRHALRRKKRDVISFVPFLTLRYIPQLVVPLYGGWLAFHGEISLGTMLAFDLLIWMVFLPLETFLDALRELRAAGPALVRVYEILDLAPECATGRGLPAGSRSPVAEFDDVTFAYDAGHTLLDGVSLRLEPGRVTALVGPSGCGKTTVLRLACGLVAPSTGAVRIHGQDARTLSRRSLRAAISLVSQDIHLFPGSIGDNIAFGRPGASPDDVVHAARLANAHEFILRLPRGYDTPAGELGARLSGGEKQRIALARAVLKDAAILLLDEPTASLDTVSEAEILDALDRLMQGRTTLLVSHRLSSLRGADIVLVLADGKIREQGRHEELMELRGLYRSLYERQLLRDAPATLAEVTA